VNPNPERLGETLTAVRHRRMVGNKPYSVYRLAKESGVDYGYVHRILHGKYIPSRDVLAKLCHALGCSRQERDDIFHAAGYRSPDEMEEEIHAA
jgi:transcriptional regulator with XRE-family HTH domain